LTLSVDFFVYFVFEALDIRPTDRKCLIARAQCYQHLGEADKALADANETLKEDNKYIKVAETFASRVCFVQYKLDLC